MPNHKCLKVTVEFEDEILIVEGDEAQKWHDGVQSMAGCCYAHRNEFPKVDWKHQEKINKS